MPLLGGLITALFVGIAEFFAKWVTRKVAGGAAAIAIFGVITTALFVGLGAAAGSIAYAMPAGSGIALGVWLMVPDNAPACLAVAFGADAAVAVYRMNVLNVQFGVYAT